MICDSSNMSGSIAWAGLGVGWWLRIQQLGSGWALILWGKIFQTSVWFPRSSGLVSAPLWFDGRRFAAADHKGLHQGVILGLVPRIPVRCVRDR